VPIILAMTIMEKNAAEYGLEGLALDPPLEYDSVATTAPTSLALVGDVIDTPLAELAALNPACLKGIAPENYPLRVPKGDGNQLVAALQLVPVEHRDSWRMHRVGSGETLATIGKKYGTTPGSIIAANSLHSSEAVAGDRLLIPAAVRGELPARRATTAAAARRRTPVRKVSQPVSKPGTKPAVILTHAVAR